MNNNNLPTDPPQQSHKIPDLDIIDLEQEEDSAVSQATEPLSEAQEKNEEKKRGIFSHINIHLVLLIVAIVFVAGIIYKIVNFGVRVDLDEIFADGPGEYSDTYDTILPLLDASSNPIYKDYSEGSKILAFGNAPFADDRNSEDNLVKLMEKETGATIYNCSISGSYMATQGNERNVEETPWNVFNAYWLCYLAKHDEAACADYLRALELLGDEAPPEAREVYDILTNIDLAEIDAVVVMYDGSDYLAGHSMINPANATDIATFAGNTEAIIEYLYWNAPNVRVIIMSPTYAFAIDDNGEYISSDIKKFGSEGPLSSYAIYQYASCVSRSVTFVDNIYNTIHEDNAKKYLEDNIHLNLAGRKKVAERFAYALDYYNQNAQEEVN